VPAFRPSLSKLWSVALHPVYRVLSENLNEWKGNATFQRVLWMAFEGRASGRGLESAVEYMVSECPLSRPRRN